jgi:sugar/nucleoside kinase (ribokinase family)
MLISKNNSDDPELEWFTEAGSTGLASLSVLTEEQKERSHIVTAVGSDNLGQIDENGKKFAQDVKARGIQHHAVTKLGQTPVCFVFSSDSSHDRTMAMYKGVASDLDRLPIVPNQGSLLHVDAYELTGGKISKLANELIHSAQFEVAIGLGSEFILEGELAKKINDYIQAGLVKILTGNTQEYSKLIGENIDPKVGLTRDPFGGKVDGFLITHGKHGLQLFNDGSACFQPAIDVPNIVSTNGAGDIAAGYVISGILNGLPVREIASRAALGSARVIQSYSSFSEDGK